MSAPGAAPGAGASDKGRGTRPLVWLPGLVLVTAAVVTMLTMREIAPLDLRVYASGVRALLDGENVYDLTYTDSHLTFTYPPFALLAFLPMAWAGDWVGSGLTIVASVLCVAFLLHVALGRTRVGVFAATVLLLGAMAAEPVWLTMHFGQINLLLAALVTADLVTGRDRWWRGVGLGIAAGIKLTPLTFLAWLLFTRQWRAAGVAVGTFLATVVVSFLGVPDTARAFWFDTLPASAGGEPNHMSDAIAHSMPKEYLGNQSAMGFFSRLFGPDTDAASLSWLLVGGVVSVAVVAVGAWLTLRGERVLGFLVAALATVVASPVSWTHHWVWAVPLAVSLWESAPRVARLTGHRVEHLRTLAGAVALVLIADAHWWAPAREMQELDWSPMQMIVGNDYLLTFLLVLGMLGVGVLRGRRIGRDAAQGEAGSPAGTSSASRMW
ncbi:glycosyltransferase 87 family protein [Kytococcus sp. Marseille-QA3725]